MKNAFEIKRVICDLARQRKELKDSTPLLAVFDLDSTLFEVSPRTQVILREFATHNETKRRYPREAIELEQIIIHPIDWGIRPPLERSQIRSTLDFFETLRTFWVERFFSSDYLQHDVLYEGALEFVQELHEAGATIKYLTGRDHERMGRGTLEVLGQWNFPVQNPHSHVILKPHQSLEDAAYKVERLINLSSRYEEIWFFENEPVIIHEVISKVPKVKVIFVDTIHSGKAETPVDLPSIKGSYK